jgi:hypothetical protein
MDTLAGRTVTYLQIKTLQAGRSIKKRNKGEKIVRHKKGPLKYSNIQIFEVEEFAWQHWCTEILQKNL